MIWEAAQQVIKLLEDICYAPLLHMTVEVEYKILDKVLHVTICVQKI